MELRRSTVPLGAIEMSEPHHPLGTHFDVDGITIIGRLDGFYSIRLHLGAGPGIFSLVLDSTVRGQWYFFFPGMMTCEDEDNPELLSTDAAFTCDLEAVPDSPSPISRVRLRASANPFAFTLSIEAGDSRIEIDRRGQCTHSFAAEIRIWGR
jgi:hypothetical protein